MIPKIIKTKRDIPSVEILTSDKDIIDASKTLARPLSVEIVRSEIARLKNRLGTAFKEIAFKDFKAEIIAEIKAISSKRISTVINGTGILVHTNLGRAPLSSQLFEEIKNHITGYGNLEFDTVTGKRGKRGELAEKYLALVSGAEAGTIVNNNAAALFIILNTLANRKKVLLSCGEMVQIGGGFRIPDILKRSGAKLVEVGTTNITTLDDYRKGLEENPALILKVHRSNFAVSGFTDEVSLNSLVKLGREYSVPVVNDLGSGVLVDTSKIAGKKEPTVQSSVKAGADLTCFSGDKLLGGVQSGLIVGNNALVKRIKKNPVYRTIRVDKLIFSAIEKLLKFYLDDNWQGNIKLWNLAYTSESELYERGRTLLKKIDVGDKIYLESSQGAIGGGALPEVPIPSVALVFKSELSPQKIAELFRRTDPPIIGRINDNNFMIDLKAIDEETLGILPKIIKGIIGQL
jgi:L-seryl-tRNA(Ser) seleniumtransferase